MSQLDIQKFSLIHGNAYVRCEDKLYYVNNLNNVYGIIKLTGDEIAIFDSKLKVKLLDEGKPQRLSEDKLKKITSITGHSRSTNYKMFIYTDDIIKKIHSWLNEEKVHDLIDFLKDSEEGSTANMIHQCLEAETKIINNIMSNSSKPQL